jgi:hypothetical protein
MRIFFLLLCLAAVRFVYAECYYSDYALQLEIRMKDGEERICYQAISACHFFPDSANDEGYLPLALAMPEETDSMEVYLLRFPFRYCPDSLTLCPEGEKQTVYAYFEPLKLALSDIHQIHLSSCIQLASFEGISTELSLSDTAYFARKAEEVIPVEGYLCYHSISVYQHYPALDSVLLQLMAYVSRGEESREAFSPENDGDAYDKEIWALIDILAKMEGVITVSGCTD